LREEQNPPQEFLNLFANAVLKGKKSMVAFMQDFINNADGFWDYASLVTLASVPYSSDDLFQIIKDVMKITNGADRDTAVTVTLHLTNFVWRAQNHDEKARDFLEKFVESGIFSQGEVASVVQQLNSPQ
jgi:ferritin